MTKTVHDPDLKVLYDETALSDCVTRLAQDIAKGNYENLLVISVLKGSFIFAADLIRALHYAGLTPEVEFISLSSYGAGTTSSGTVRVVRDIESDVAGRDILLIDDILESGRTISFARDLMLKRGANRADIAVLLDKAEKRVVQIEADYVGFACEDLFVVGYGMDKAHAYRQLPFVGFMDS